MILDRFRRPDLARPERPPEERGGLGGRIEDALVTRLLETGLAERLIEGVVETLMKGPMLDQLIEKVILDIEASPAVDALVDRQIGRVLPALQESEALRSLIRHQAGAYLQHLERHPDQVRRLIQTESRGVLREFRDALRERASSGDDRVETWVRRVLGRG